MRGPCVDDAASLCGASDCDCAEAGIEANSDTNAVQMTARPRLDPMIFMNPPMIWFSLT
jgi:hypothetical protein